MFLDAAGRCALHRTTIERDGRTASLKPFFCAAFPVTIVDGVLMHDDLNDDHPECCTPTAGGARGIVDACAGELEHVLGPAGTSELRTRTVGGPGPGCSFP